MTDDLVARVRSPFALTERDAQEIADALESRGKRIDELESRLVDKDARIAELEAALKKADDALSWLILETCDEIYQAAYPQIYADLIDANIASRAALKGEK